MFGELVAVWLRAAWAACGRPLPVTVAEIGPGRGTLMKDMLRTLSKLDPKLRRTCRIRHGRDQRKTGGNPEADACNGSKRGSAGTQTIDTSAAPPLLIVGNELFDAVPIRQFVKSAGTVARTRGRARRGRQADASSLAAGAPDPALLPPGRRHAPQRARSSKCAPARAALMETIADANRQAWRRGPVHRLWLCSSRRSATRCRR